MKNIMKQIAAIGIIVGMLLFTMPQRAEAQTLFGGLVLWTHFCTCSGNFLLFISPPNGGFFSYYADTQGFANFTLPRSGIWTLGLYSPGGVCLDYVGFGCAQFFPAQGTITPVTGSSL